MWLCSFGETGSTSPGRVSSVQFSLVGAMWTRLCATALPNRAILPVSGRRRAVSIPAAAAGEDGARREGGSGAPQDVRRWRAVAKSTRRGVVDVDRLTTAPTPRPPPARPLTPPSRLPAGTRTPRSGKALRLGIKATVGLASHWPCVTDFSGIST